MSLPFKLPLQAGSTYIEDADGLPVCSAGGNVAATNAVITAVNAFYTPPSAAQVKRYRWDPDGMWCMQLGYVIACGPDLVDGHDFDALARQMDGLTAERDALKARVEAAKLIFERACPWFQIQGVAHPKLSAKAQSIWESMQRWLAGDRP
jgi:hypothetical protein